MIIDFHTHVFPPKIAGKTISMLSERSKLNPNTDGTADGLIKSMKKAGIDYSVVLPIATRPEQAGSINTYAAEITGKDGIISFGSIHPFSPHWKKQLDEISSLGLKVIKLHPDYQGFFIDDEKIYPIIDYALSLGLIVLFHSGVDIGLPGIVHCPPKSARKMIDALGGGKLIFAHMGGYECWDETEAYLLGKNVYLDLSFTLGKIANERFVKIIRAHGADKCLFGTDSPWGSQESDVKAIKDTGLNKSELDRVMYKNAAKLLNLKEVFND